MPQKNIHLFSGPNKISLMQTLTAWREKFIEKHEAMNLAEVRKEDLYETFLSDCMSPGFMGMTRMIILPDILFKTDKEIRELEALEGNKDIEEAPSFDITDDALWIDMLEKAPETNFFLFVGNKNPITDLEKWLTKNATLHDFQLPTTEEISQMIVRELGVTRWQASRIQERLNHDYYFITQEITKLKGAQKATWTDEELKSVLPNYFEENNFAILNPLWDNNANVLLETFQDTLRTADRELTMAMITTMIRKVLIASSLPDTSVAQIPMIKPSQIQTAKKIKHHQKHLQKLYDAIVRVDTDEKQGESIDKLDAFLMVLLTYCAAPEVL